MNATSKTSTTTGTVYVLWFRPFKLDRRRGWVQVATAETERACWEKMEKMETKGRGEWLVLPSGYEP